MSRDFITRSGALFAEFDDAELARRALEDLRGRGYQHLETFSPFPLTKDQTGESTSWSALALVVFAMAAVGALTGYLVQRYANAASYPLNIGGRPADAVLAFLVASPASLPPFCRP